MTAPGVVRRYVSLFRENRGLVQICVATLISMTGHGIIAPVLPLFAKGFGVSATAIGLVVGMFGMARIFFNLPAGLLSQRFGQKVMMGIGLILTGLSTWSMGTAGGLAGLIFWRFLAGTGSAMSVTAAMSFVTQISKIENRGRLLSLQLGSILLGSDIGPIIGGFVADLLGIRWPFYLAGILAGGAAVWVLLSLPTPIKEPGPETSSGKVDLSSDKRALLDLHTIKALLMNPTFVLVGLLTTVVFFTRAGARHTLLPLLSSGSMGMSATQLGLLLATIATVNLLMVMPAGSLADRLGRKAVLLPGALLSLLGLCLFALGSNVWIFYAAGVVLGIGTGFIGPAPAAYAGDLAPPGKTGITMALHRTFGDVGFVVGPVFLGLVADATEGIFAGISGLGVAMIFNALLLVAVSLLVVTVAVETAGRGQHVFGREAIGYHDSVMEPLSGSRESDPR